MTNPIDPELRAFARAARILVPPKLWALKLHHKLALKACGKPTDGLTFDEVQIDRSGGDGQIRAVIYKTETASPDDGPLPVMLYLHGGGYAIGLPEQAGDNIKRWIDKRSAIFVVPQYRRSLEAPYPAAIDDCYDTLLWVQKNIESLGGDIQNIGVMGHSAGGGLTAALSLRNRDRGDIPLAFQMPIYPMIDDRMITPSSQNPNLPVWNARANKIGWDLYLKDHHARGANIPYDAAPARCEDFSGLPPTFTFVGDQDPFLDETKIYIDNLRAAGVPVKSRIFRGGYHGYENFVPKAAISRDTNNFLLEGYAQAIDGQFERWMT